MRHFHNPDLMERNISKKGTLINTNSIGSYENKELSLLCTWLPRVREPKLNRKYGQDFNYCSTRVFTGHI